MRVFRFRAYDKTNREMMHNISIVGRHIILDYNGHTGYDLHELELTYLDVLDGENEYEIMQYTGLNDRSGREIYEGDILFCLLGEDRYEKRVVCWDNYQAKYKAVPLNAYHYNAGNGSWTGFDLHGNNAEILGNVFEHPNLIVSA